MQCIRAHGLGEFRVQGFVGFRVRGFGRFLADIFFLGGGERGWLGFTVWRNDGRPAGKAYDVASLFVPEPERIHSGFGRSKTR